MPAPDPATPSTIDSFPLKIGADGASLLGPCFPVVGVGASAGGLEAFSQLLQFLPPQPGLALVLVVHLDPRRESLLTSILSQSTRMPVREVKQDDLVEIDHVYVIPPNTQLSMAGGTLSLRPRDTSPAPHLSIDHFFRTLAEELGHRSVGIVLSGGGTDGTLGLEAIKAAGGITFAQDEDSASQSSMPRHAAKSGCVDFVLSLDKMAQELIRIGSHPYLARPVKGQQEKGSLQVDADLERLFALLRARKGIDFRHYKRNTIQRRLERRMALLGITDLAELVKLIQSDPTESEALYQEFLLHVTSFFRDPGAFDALKKIAFPAISKQLGSEGSYRIWVPGCSTGEEAYSIAIALTEFLEETSATNPIKILATDVNDQVLVKARAGLYPETIADAVSLDRLRRCFYKDGDQYRIRKSIRDLIVFAQHNVFRDPPFARLDLISCRNLLIYFDVSLQRRVFPLFHYSLRPEGFLLLGPSETIGTHGNLFTLEDRESCLHVRTLTPSRFPLDLMTRVEGERGHMIQTNQIRLFPEPGGLQDVQREADRVLLRYAPPGVLIDGNLHVLQFRGDTSPYLRNPPGTASLEVLRMAQNGLLPDLRLAILSAQASEAPVRQPAGLVDAQGLSREIMIQVIPIRVGSGPRCFLVLFEESGSDQRTIPQLARPTVEQISLKPEEVDVRLIRLERELDATRDHLQAVIEEHEAANEELKSANEEILASNEELQSTNEDLQTAKEEMQSANEELETTNEELHHRNHDLGLVNDDLTNLLAAAYIPLVMVSRDLRIRRFTAQAETLFNLLPADLGRPIREIRSELQIADLEKNIVGVIDNLAAQALEVQDRSGHWYSLRIRPYETLDNRIDGAVLTAIDIHAVKSGEQKVRESLEFVSSILETVRESLLVLDASCTVQMANRSFLRTFHLLPPEVLKQSLFEVGKGQWNSPQLREFLTGENSHATASRECELEHAFPGLGKRIIRASVRPISNESARPEAVVVPATVAPLRLLALEDITEQRKAESDRHELQAKMFHSQKLESLGVLAGGVAHDLNNMLTPVLGYAELVKGSLLQTSPAVAQLEEIMKATQRAADLVRQMLAYAGKGKFVIEPLDLSALAQEMSGFLQTVVSKDVELTFVLAPNLPAFDGDATQIRQVFMNLVTNASESMADKGGQVILRTSLVQADAQMLHSKYVKEDPPPGLYVVLEVSDTGSGMTSDSLEKIFDPFFSTKFVGRGLGLAAVFGIVQGHHGTIRVDSELGKGSTFRIYFPCSAKVIPTTVLDSPPLPVVVETGTILVIDDEPAVRAVATQILLTAGFTVLQANDGLDGIEVVRGHPEIAAVLLDLTMPRLGGFETAKTLRSLRPNLPIVLMSGYSVEEVTMKSVGKGITCFVQKPFKSASLLATLKKALD